VLEEDELVEDEDVEEELEEDELVEDEDVEELLEELELEEEEELELEEEELEEELLDELEEDELLELVFSCVSQSTNVLVGLPPLQMSGELPPFR
jgi:hypothetical protein